MEDEDSDAATLVNEPVDAPTDTQRHPASTRRRRDTFKSSGRGGIGNIRRSPLSREVRPTYGLNDLSHANGREPAIRSDRVGVFSIGRGGVGNIRPPLREPQSITAAEAEHRVRLIRERTKATIVRSIGRGGAGNIQARNS
ncbi:hypothetical protein HD554DRAFT_701539 [Boletus coccyginus]|nr:hypothetical protein HD554DRAFT_701539 [Boletus coccyginus]